MRLMVRDDEEQYRLTAVPLPKPRVILDDQPPAEWRQFRYVHPFNVASIETEA
ncbi:MAG TPA: hypothetical protein VM686_23665 [Polyangiaceae bacterium]|nr:hypothetical protein [Polyangiaceae bacterium]